MARIEIAATWPSASDSWALLAGLAWGVQTGGRCGGAGPGRPVHFTQMANLAFPFGQPVRCLVQRDRTPKKVFILGVYASAVHARWVDPSGRQLVLALAVASEPYIFWRGGGGGGDPGGHRGPDRCRQSRTYGREVQRAFWGRARRPLHSPTRGDPQRHLVVRRGPVVLLQPGAARSARAGV